MSYVLNVAPVPSVPVKGSDARFPVRRIFCVGRNYAEHAREMGFDPDREPPFFFTKPGDAIVMDGAEIPYPPLTGNFHYEIELVVAISGGGLNIKESEALEHVYGYAVGLDMTRRDLQLSMRKIGRPWCWGKAFDNSAPIGEITPVAQCGHIDKGQIWLDVNGERQQDGDINQLIWSVPDVIAHLTQSIALAPGDLIMTGTPAGVGPTVAGDRLSGGIDGLGNLSLTIVEPTYYAGGF